MPSAKRDALLPLDPRARPLAETCTIVLGVLAKQVGDRQLFTRGGRMVAVRRRPSGEPFILEIDRRELATVMTGLFDFFTPGGAGRPPRHLGPPAPVMEALLGSGQWPFPPLDGLSAVPLLRRDGTIQVEPGYDPINRIFQHPTIDLLADIPRKPKRADVKRAVDTLLEVLSGFPLEDEASVGSPGTELEFAL